MGRCVCGKHSDCLESDPPQTKNRLKEEILFTRRVGLNEQLYNWGELQNAKADIELHGILSSKEKTFRFARVNNPDRVH